MANLFGLHRAFLYKNMLDNTENAEIIEEVAMVDEAPPEPIVEGEADENAEAEEVVEETAEEVVEEVQEETTEEAKDETPVLITFDGTEDETVFNEKAEQIFAKYDVPEELQAYIEAVKSKSVVETPEIFAQIADYGDVEAVTAVLDEHNTLYSRREEDNGYRPNTDKFVENLVAKDPLTADYLYFDISSQPSTKYQGINKFEEAIAEALALEGESVNTVLNRYYHTMKVMREGANLPLADVPDFVPAELYGAYKTLAKETRDEMSMWDDPELYSLERSNKLNELRNIQKGINADLAEAQRTVQVQQERQQKLADEALNTQVTFYGEMRKTMAEKLKSVQFSTDPKLNTLLANQQVTTLIQAFSEESDGEFARQILKDAGIEFDYGKAQRLVDSVHKASQALTIAKHAVDAQGKPLNPVDLNKAQSTFKTVTQEWLKFADEILEQEKEVTATGTAKALETEIAKIKIEPKARPVAKTIPTAATNGNGDRPPASVRYGTPEWDKWWAQKTLNAEAQKASAYA